MIVPKKMIETLAKRHPGKKIILIPEIRPTEVICELDRDPHGKWSTAVALVGRSESHWHEKLKETYSVVRGKLRYMNGTLKNGEVLTPDSLPQVIWPGCHHWAVGIGKPAEVLVTSVPAWSLNDHHLSR